MGLSANAFATSFDSLDLFYVNGEVEIQPAGAPTTTADGDGFGAKFRGSVGDEFFFSGEYQNLRSSGDQGDYTEWRAGLGAPFGSISSVTTYGLIEYVNSEIEVAGLDNDGVAGQLGALFSPVAWLSVYGQIGYLELRDASGLEYLVGLALQVKRWGGLFAEYRANDLDLDNIDADLEFSGYRAGIYLLVSK
jgi:hypothetical protein